jgi:hypothetical protein
MMYRLNQLAGTSKCCNVYAVLSLAEAANQQLKHSTLVKLRRHKELDAELCSSLQGSKVVCGEKVQCTSPRGPCSCDVLHFCTCG